MTKACSIPSSRMNKGYEQQFPFPDSYCVHSFVCPRANRFRNATCPRNSQSTKRPKDQGEMPCWLGVQHVQFNLISRIRPTSCKWRFPNPNSPCSRAPSHARCNEVLSLHAAKPYNVQMIRKNPSRGSTRVPFQASR